MRWSYLFSQKMSISSPMMTRATKIESWCSKASNNFDGLRLLTVQGDKQPNVRNFAVERWGLIFSATIEREQRKQHVKDKASRQQYGGNVLHEPSRVCHA